MENNGDNHYRQLALGMFGTAIVTAVGYAGKKYYDRDKEPKPSQIQRLDEMTRSRTLEEYLEKASILNEKRLKKLRPVVLAAAAFAVKHTHFRINDVETSLLEQDYTRASTSRAVMHLQTNDLIVPILRPDEQLGHRVTWRKAGEALIWAAEQPELFGELYELTHSPADPDSTE